MAVTKIRRISRWILYVVTLINLAILALFYFGGVGEPLGIDGSFKNPTYTGELLIWAYILLALCAVGMLLFGFVQFGSKFQTNPKAAIVTLGIFAGFAVLLLVAYFLGDGTPLTTHINPDSQQFNTEFWLKITDMWLYAIYILSGLAACAIVWGSIRKLLSK